MKHVAVLVPGIMGSELVLDGEVIWPGPVQSLLLPYQKMDELMRDDLVVTDVIRSFFISEQYQALIDDLGVCGFHETDETLIICAYDWRKDNRIASERLAKCVEEAISRHGADAEVSVIAHSMGGLISRYYLESGLFNNRSGFANVRRLITLGTPHRGAPLALTAALGMEKRLFLSPDQVKRLANDDHYPSLYQLLPPQGEPFAWDEGRAAEYEPVDIYRDVIARSLGLADANLRAAHEFHEKLDLSKRPPNVRYFFFVGTRQTTPSSVMLLDTGGTYRVRKVEPEDAGDGTVPTWSGGVTGTQNRPVGGEHGTIYKNDDLRRTMAALLGKPGVLAAVPERVEVALRDQVTNPGEFVHVVLTFGGGASRLDGELRLERAVIDANNKLSGYSPASAQYPVHYTGMTAEKLSLTFTAPDRIGIYRVAYYPAEHAEPVGSSELFVQG